MKRMVIAALFSVLGVAVNAAEITKIEYEPLVTAQQGPLPGTVVLGSQLFSSGFGVKGNVGEFLGECWTLVRESDIKRDFAKKPVTKDEILGFSCTRMKVFTRPGS